MATCKQNLNPHKAARVAMILWNKEYANQFGGSMDFWDKLTESQKQTCRECLAQILEARSEGDE